MTGLVLIRIGAAIALLARLKVPRLISASFTSARSGHTPRVAISRLGDAFNALPRTKVPSGIAARSIGHGAETTEVC